MDVRYLDGPAATLVTGFGRIERGETATVPDDLGKRLITQGWEQVKSTRPTKTTATDAGKKEE